MSDVHEGVQALYDEHWNHSWTDLPPEQEKMIEEAFVHVQRVHDLQQREVEE